MAGRTFVLVRDGNSIFRTIKCIGKGDLKVIPEVCTCPSPGPPGSPGKCIKDIAQSKVPEEVVITGRFIAGRIPGPELRMSHLVILGFFLGVAQDLVGLVDLFKFLFRILAALVQVRVIFPCKVTERLFQIIG